MPRNARRGSDRAILSQYVPLILFILVVAASAATLFGLVWSSRNDPSARNGFLLTSNIDTGAPVMLKGDWEYYPNAFLFPSDFQFEGGAKDGRKAAYVYVPGGMPNSYGFGTYRLVFTCVTTGNIFAIKTTDISSAARIYVDGALIAKLGEPSTSASIARAENRPREIVFPMDILRSSHEIIVHVSNYDFHEGGILGPLYFGSQPKTYEFSKQYYFVDTVILVSLCLLTIFISLILTLKIKIRNIIYLLFFTLALMLSASNDPLFRFVSGAFGYKPYILMILALYPMLGCFLWLYLTTPAAGRKMETYWKGSLLWSGPALAALLLVMPLRAQGFLVAASHLYVFIVSVYCFIELIPHLKEKDYQSLLQTLSLFSIDAFLCLAVFYHSGRLYGSAYSALRAFFIIGFVVLQLIHVAQQLAQIYISNEGLVQRLVVSDRLRNELLQVTSHELRTPLHGILNISESLIEKAQNGGLTAHNAKDLKMVSSLAQRMRTIISDLYGSTAQRGGPDNARHPTSLIAEVNGVFEMFRYITNPNKLQFITRVRPDAAVVYADDSKLWQILNNLIGNAVKYTDSGTITVIAKKKDQDTVVVSVVDTGTGMPMEETDTIFDRSYRLPASADQYEGQGLGLYITKLLVEELEGTIRVEQTKPGYGTTISFTLPSCPANCESLRRVGGDLENNAPGMSSPSIMDSMIPANAKLLVVDDNKDNLKVIRTIFEDCNFDIITADCGRSVLDLVQEEAFDIAILDVMMADITGFELCQRIRTRFSPFQLPVLLLTAHDSTEDILTGFWSGANDYVVKPADSIELRARVFNLIALKQSVSRTIENEISFLQAQIKPHFLYNALNTISAIALTDGNSASELIDDLGFYLRKSFQTNGKNDVVSIETELEIVKAYLSIEKARFGERLQTRFEVQDDLRFTLPLLTIQPIVENAIRHNSLKSNAAIEVTIGIIRNEGFHSIEISDNGKGMDVNKVTSVLAGVAEKDWSGIGLQNVNRVLMLRYSRPLEFSELPNGGTKVSFQIPINERTKNE